MAALALVALGRTAYFQLSQRTQVIERNFDMAALQARAFEDHLTQSFDVISQTLANLAEVDRTANATAATPKEFTAALRAAGYLRSVALLDAHGAIIASSNPRNLGRNVGLTDFFPPQSALAPPLRVGPPWSGRDFADGRPGTPEHPAGAGADGFLPVVRDVVLDNGSRVMLLAAVNGDFFINHYSQVLDSTAATVDLLRYDGAILLSTSATRAPGVRPGADAVATRLAQSNIGRFEQRLADGRDILTTYRASRAYPFVIVVHLDKAQVLAGWREQALTSVAVTISLLLAVSILATWNYFRLKRSARSRDSAKAAFQASEAQYRNTFEHAAVGIAHATREGRFLRCNQHLCDLLGYSAEELTQKTVDEITCPDDLAQDLLHRQRLLEGEIASYQFEKRFVRKSGELVWARVNACVVRDAAGAIDYRVAVIEDIHLRKLTGLAMEALNTDLTGEAFLRLMTRTLATLLDVECVFVAVAAPGSTRRLETRALFVDGEFAADYSYDLAGTPCDGVVGNELCLHAEQVQARFPGDAMLAAMGIESYAAVPLGGAAVEGAPFGVLGVMSRQALRRVDAVRSLLPLLASRAGAELVRERDAKKFRDLFDSSPTAIFLIDRHSTVRMSSRAGERLFGWAPQALGGQQVGILFPTEHRTAYEALFRRFVAAEIVGAADGGSKDMWGRRRDGSAFPAQVQMRVLETADGRMTVAHVQDITVRKQAESALRQLNEELESKVVSRTVELSRARDEAEQANRAKSAFLAAMSHEIRTPMNGVVGMIDVLEQSALRGEQVQIVKTVRESAHALLAIVDDVLDFSKIEAGQFAVDREPMDVAAVVEAVCDGLDHMAAGKGVELTLFTDPAIPARVLGDASRLRQVLLNLAGNAIKFSSAQGRAGRVAVRAGMLAGGAPQGMLEFSVTDNGIGMDQATQARLFTPFTQADTSTTRRYGGTGLGLSISHGLVDLMGGAIAVRSAAGAGSTFTVRLPLVPLPVDAQGDAGVDAGVDVEGAVEADAAALDLGGLCCLVLGGPESPADDLAVYLAHAGADKILAEMDVGRVFGDAYL